MRSSRLIPITTLALAVGCDSADELACPFDASISSDIIAGRNVPAGIAVPVPLVVQIAVASNVVLTDVESVSEDANDSTSADMHHHVSGQFNAATSRWELDFYPTDLEYYRGGDGFTATMTYTATDACKSPHAFAEQSTIALGPKLGSVVTNLQIAPLETISCFIPTDTPRDFQISADAADRGAVVSVSATHGTWENNQAIEVLPPLTGPVGARVTTTAKLTPTAAGTANLYAFAPGAQSAVYSVVVAGAPTSTASAATVARNTPSFLEFVTTGYFDTCTVAEGSLGNTQLQLEDESNGVFADVKGPVIEIAKPMPLTCGTPRYVHLSAAFLSAAPDGDVAIVTCHEALYSRETSQTVSVAAKPSTSTPVTGLSVPTLSTLPDCYVPSNGQITPTVTVTADPTAKGGSVTLSATHGTWTGGTTTIPLTLAPGSPLPSASAIFSPTSAGLATITATANQSSPTTVTLTVADPPIATPTATTISRGATAFIDFTTAGNFDTCTAEASSPGTTTITELLPAATAFGTTPHSVLQTPQRCDAPELVRASVVFGPTTPDGATVTVRCDETAYGRSASATIAVDPLPPMARSRALPGRE